MLTLGHWGPWGVRLPMTPLAILSLELKVTTATDTENSGVWPRYVSPLMGIAQGPEEPNLDKL